MAAISVVIPAYNRESTLGVSLDCLLAQTHRDWEAIVVDDGSSDGTYALATEYAQRDARIRVKQQANAGVSGARNAALAMASNPWVFFLDADDWISLDAFALLSSALERNPEADAVHGGCIRVMIDGTQVRERPLPPNEDLFLAFADTCAFSIHTCLIKTALVRAVGGFDGSLVTCEDWDLWQRVMRTGPRLARITDAIAYYRIRPASASRNGAQLLADGLRVIERGHGSDPRLSVWPGPLHRGRPAEFASSSRLYLTAYAAGLALAAGGDALELLSMVPDGAPGDVDGDGVAETIFSSLVEARGGIPADWGDLPADLQPRLDAFIEAMGEKSHDNWLAFVAAQALAQLVLEHTNPTEDAMVGSTEFRPISVGTAIPHVNLRVGARRVLLHVRWGEAKMGSVVVAAVDGVLAGPVAADAIADELAWGLLERFLAQTIYPTLRVTQTEEGLTVHRGEVIVASADATSMDEEAPSIHALAGWTIFLQELWGLAQWTSDRFYERGRRGVSTRGRETLSVSSQPPVVEITEELPEIVGARGSVVVQVMLAGVPLMLTHVQSTRGRIRPDALRRAITFAGGYELCIVAVREGLLAPWPQEMPLRMRLQAAARRRRAEVPQDNVAGELPSRVELWGPLLRETVPPGRRALVIGRRSHGDLSGSIGRIVGLPVAAAAEMAEAAHAAAEPVFEFGDAEGPPDMALYAPFVMAEPRRAPGELGDQPLQGVDGAREQASSQGFASFNGGAVGSQQSREQTLAHLPGRITRALERVTGRGRPPVPGRLRSPKRAHDSPRGALPHVNGDGLHGGAGGSPSLTKQMPILMYHRVAEGITGRERRWSVTPVEFEDQLAFLKENHFRCVSIEEWAQAGALDRPVAGRPVMLTFDDGYADFAEHAVPLLEKYGFRAEVFVVTGYVGGNNAWETAWPRRDQLMDWATLVDLPQATVRIGSHTHNHRMLPSLSSEDVLRELVTSRLTLEDRLGRPVSSIAYPYGPADGAVARLCGAAGYDYAYTTLHWWATIGRDLLRLPRLEVQGAQPIADFEVMLSTPF
jgi:peptidoglycan/xylan/chitin deacetylase (PgdA/CDA1 family)